MRKEFEMTQAQRETLLEACKPVPLIALQCGTPPSRQQNANDAWERLGKEMGFDYKTVRPTGNGDLFFTAEVIDKVQAAIDTFNNDITKTHKDNPDSREHYYARKPILTTDCDYEIVGFSGVEGKRL